LVRIILLHSEKTTVTVTEEMKALELYLELECMRFDGSFTYTIEADKTLNPDQVEIPAMLIQPYVENAIQHGIRPLPGGGKLRVYLGVKNNMLCCVVEDNGIGRQKAALHKNEEHRSFGTLITKERLVIINQLFQTGLSENIVDLYDQNGHARGTRVEIFIPL